MPGLRNSVQIIEVPYDSGHKHARMGNGPRRLRQEWKPGPFCSVDFDEVEVEESFPLEIGTTFKVIKQLSAKVRDAAAKGRFPLVLAGGCISSVGTLAGLNSQATAMLWLDAHGDFNTPETTTSGYLDGMALAACTGRCWQSLTAMVPGFRPVLEANTVLLGARDFDSPELALLKRSKITIIGPDVIRERSAGPALETTLNALSGRKVYLHIDLDVLDATEGRVNHFPQSGGLMLDDVREIIALIRKQLNILAASITAYDPDFDDQGKAARAATAMMDDLSGFPVE